MQTYELYNPQIFGDMNTVYKSDSPLLAAESFWTTLSSHTNNEVPGFAFTLKNMEGGTLHHFAVSETSRKKNKISYDITEIDVPEKDEHILKKKINLVKKKDFQVLNGGGSSDIDLDSDSDSDSSPHHHKKYTSHSPCAHPFYKCLNRTYYNTPIFYIWYTPKVYSTYIDDTSFTTFIPSFVPPIHPYVELYTAYWYE